MKKIAVIGMGVMGKSISLALAQKNYDVTVVTSRGKKGFLDFRRFVEEQVKLTGGQKSQDEILSRISCFDNLSKVSCDLDLVIEAVKEDLRIKQQLFKRIDTTCPENTILSSITSSLNITKISKFMVRPGRMIGLHFFNPVQVMRLVEVVPGNKTSEETVKTAITFVNELGKIPLVVPDQPGFLVNRILFPMINEAISVLDNCKISAEAIDVAMRTGVNHPLGPLHLADFIGLDVCLDIFKNLYKATKSAKYRPHPLLIEKVKANHLGRKTGKGFFDYSNV
jgi:3-hydroxybutyryl-CoA dehydrogenase